MKEYKRWDDYIKTVMETADENAAFIAYKKKRGGYVKEAVKKLQKKPVFYGPVQIKKMQPRPRSLTNDEVLFCRRAILWKTYEQLAEQFQTSVQCVRRAVKGETYAYLNHIEKPQR